MANRIKGETSVTFGGQTYTLRLDFNALAEFEDRCGVNAMDLLASEDGVARMSVGQMRAFVHASLMQEHPDAPVALAGQMISEDLLIVQRLCAAAFPGADDGGDGSDGGAAGNG